MAEKLNLEQLITAVLDELQAEPEDYETFRTRVLSKLPSANGALQQMLKQKQFAAQFRFDGAKPILQVFKKPVPPIP